MEFTVSKFLKIGTTVLNYPATDLVCWSRILYVQKSVSSGYVFLFINNSKSLGSCLAF